MEIDFAVDGDEKRLEKLGECAITAHVRFSRETRTACILKGDAAVIYGLTDSTYCKRIMDELCIESSIMTRLLEMQLAEISTDVKFRLSIYEKYEEYDKIVEIVAETPEFKFGMLSDRTQLSCSLRDKTGCTPLMEACQGARRDFCLKLLDTEFAQVGQVSRTGITALFRACYWPDSLASVIRRLLDISPSSCGQIAKGGQTCLMQICKSPEHETPEIVELARIILASGQAKPGHVAQDHTTALIHACIKRKIGITTELLKTGKSKPRHRTPMRKSAYTYAIGADIHTRQKFYTIFAKYLGLGKAHP